MGLVECTQTSAVGWVGWVRAGTGGGGARLYTAGCSALGAGAEEQRVHVLVMRGVGHVSLFRLRCRAGAKLRTVTVLRRGDGEGIAGFAADCLRAGLASTIAQSTI